MPEVIMPKMGDAMEEGTLLQWLKQDGETVAAGDVIAEIETDKSNVEIEAEDAGVLHTQAVPGAVVAVGKVIAMIGEDAPKSAPAAPAEAAAPACPIDAGPSRQPSIVRETASPTSPAPRTNGTGRLKASPLAKSVAKQRGLDIAQIKGTGPLGRVIEADVLAFAGNQPASAPAAEAPAAPSTAVQTDLPPSQATPAQPQKRADTTLAPITVPTELSAMRKVIARRMVEARPLSPTSTSPQKWTWPKRWHCARS